jgi:hypothetical protein
MDVGIDEKKKQILTSIIDLQNQEKLLYASLEDASLTPEKRKSIVDKINELSQTRITLYASLKTIYGDYQENITDSRDILSQQFNAIDIVENELNQMKIRLQFVDNERVNKLRLIEINTYYGNRYNAHSKLMKTIVITCVPLIFLATLANRGFLPSKIYGLLTIIILVIGGYFIFYQITDISNRSRMNWDEYDWYFNKKLAPSPVFEDGTTSSSFDPWDTTALTCIGAACCNKDTVFDSKLKMCVPTKKETFGNMEKYGYKQLKMTPVYNNVQNSLSSLQKF